MRGGHCEILSPDSVSPGRSASGYDEKTAREAGMRRIVFITTNDNIEAMYFYQRRAERFTQVQA